MSDKKFVDGLLVKPPHTKAPDFVKCAISLHRDELIQWLRGQDSEWVNVDVKQAKSGKWYAEVNDWKPDNSQKSVQNNAPSTSNFDDFDEQVPF